MRKLGRLVLVVSLGVAGSALLVGFVGVAQLGSSSSREVIRRILDDKHILGPKTDWWRAARKLERSNPAEDARRALRSGDTRLLALAGVGPTFPGLDDKRFQSYASRYGVRFLAAGCEVSCDEELRYREAGFQYAKTYNSVILASLKR